MIRTFALAIALGFSLSGCALFAAIGALPSWHRFRSMPAWPAVPQPWRRSA